MMDETFVRQIVERLLVDPEFQHRLAQLNVRGDKPSCLVLLNYVPGLSQVLQEVQRTWGHDYRLSILPSASVPTDKISLPEEMSWLDPQEACSRSDWVKVLIPACSANTLAKLALGIRDNAILEAAGRALSHGVPVELGTSYLGLTPQTPPAYRELYARYLRQVEAYGVKVWSSLPGVRLGAAQALDSGSSPSPGVLQAPDRPALGTSDWPASGTSGCLSKSGAAEAQQRREIVRFVKKLLTDRDASSLPAGALVITKKTTVVSPLARDTLKTRRIELRQEREDEP